MHLYNHKVQYYETDKMGIVHHSNYIRWMEESRISFLESIVSPGGVRESRAFLFRGRIIFRDLNPAGT